MSIVALKRKTNTQYNNMSVSQKGFSLNGTHRSQGYVGQTSLSRSLPRTLMRGNTERGHGGCCGTYPRFHINTVGTGLGNNLLNDTNVIKSSVLDTNGMIMTKYRWARRPIPHTSFKENSSYNNSNTSSEYINKLKRTTLSKQCSTTKDVIVVNKQCCPFMKRHYLDYHAEMRNDSITKNPLYDSYEEYNSSIIKDCTTEKVFKKESCSTAFACNNSVK